jgi:filamentous hemagglutinin family protein
MRSHFKHAFLYLACQFSYVFAAPAGGVVAQGGANIIGQGTNQVTINQSTNKAIINWQTFDVGNNQSVTFNTPGANAATLNRISGNATQILGNVTSNGQLWLINPNGIMFGKNAQINVAGLVASTLDINDHDFMTGNYRLEQQGASFAKIVNQGHINAEGGYVAMLAPQIENTGIIQAKLGTVAMGAGTKATLQFQSNQMLNFVIDEGASVPMFDENGQSVAALSHAGQIEANGGQVLLTAQSINSMLDQSINVSGIIQADTVEDRPGKIVLLAKANAVVNDGRLSAQGLNSGEQGGKVAVIGRNVGLFGTSNINASGAAGGGEIRVGRDDTDPNAFEANATVVARGVQLKAEATQTGNGGLIETSGHYLNVSGAQVSTKAATGQSGTWLLDPYNVTISNAATSTEDFSGGAYTPTADDSIINIDDLLANLENGSVSILTAGEGSQAGDITVSSDLDYSGANDLTLIADGSVYLTSVLSCLLYTSPSPRDH